MDAARTDAALHVPLDLVRLASDYLGRRGSSSPRLEAEVLLAAVLGVPRIQLYLDFEKPLQAGEVDAYRQVLRRRGGGEPVAYIVGRREFWSLDLAVDPRVLIPRPETEVLVESCLSRMGESGRVLDLGVGSGAIVLALLHERPAWRGVGVDRSPGALELAARNAEDLVLGTRVELRCGDLFAAVGEEVFDLVVSNPPYIPSGQIAGLEPTVAAFEPREALDGGVDGLDVIRRIITAAPAHLTVGGTLALEVGDGQAAAVCALLADAGGYHAVATTADCAGRDRVVTAVRAAG